MTKDIICKEYGFGDVIPFHLEFLVRGGMELFLPLSFRTKSGGIVEICYNLSEVDPLGKRDDGDEAPYIASSLIKGMKGAMDRYIFPNQYLLRNKVAYMKKDGSVKIAYVPFIQEKGLPKDPAKVMRNKTIDFIKETFGFLEGVNAAREEKQMGNHILNETLSILSDSTIGMDTCVRKIEKLKEEAYYYSGKDKSGSLDLYGNII